MTIKTQTAHVIENEAEAALMQVLEDHFGEDTDAGRSIRASSAIVALGGCMIHLLAQFEDKDRNGVWEAMKARSAVVRRELIVQAHRGGAA